MGVVEPGLAAPLRPDAAVQPEAVVARPVLRVADLSVAGAANDGDPALVRSQRSSLRCIVPPSSMRPGRPHPARVSIGAAWILFSSGRESSRWAPRLSTRSARGTIGITWNTDVSTSSVARSASSGQKNLVQDSCHEALKGADVM